jgi:hypothetical protein
MVGSGYGIKHPGSATLGGLLDGVANLPNHQRLSGISNNQDTQNSLPVFPNLDHNIFPH